MSGATQSPSPRHGSTSALGRAAIQNQAASNSPPLAANSPSPGPEALGTKLRAGTGTVSPSEFCSKTQLFRAWHIGLGLNYKIANDEDCPFLRQHHVANVATNIKFPKLPDLNNQDDQDENLHTFHTLFNISDDPSRPTVDPFELATTAPTLCKTYRNFVEGGQIDEANMRKPVDQLLDEIFTFPGYRARSEVPMSLPEIPHYIREHVKLAADPTTRIDAVVIKITSVNDQDQSLLAQFLARPEACLYPMEYGAEPHIALPDIIFEYKVKDTATLLNQIVMDCLGALQHRQFLGLGHREIHALAVEEAQFTYFCASWENEKPTLKRYKPHELKSFEDWLEFYIVLHSIRAKIKADHFTIYPENTRLRPAKRSASETRSPDPSAKRHQGSSNAAPETRSGAAANDGGAAGGEAGAAGGQLDNLGSPSSSASVRTPEDKADGFPLHAPRPTRPKSAYTLLADNTLYEMDASEDF